MVAANVWIAEKFPNPTTSPEQDYWLGFLMCDGYIQTTDPAKTCFSLHLELAEVDIETVHAFAEFIEARTRKPKVNRKRVRVGKACTKEMHLLAEHGIEQRKTGNEIYPESITNHAAFVRGVMDGDGSVNVNPKKARSLELAFYSQSVPFLEKVAARLEKDLGFPIPKLGNADGCKRVSYSLGKQRAKDLYNYLYSDEFHRLERKQEILRKFADGPLPPIGRPATREVVTVVVEDSSFLPETLTCNTCEVSKPLAGFPNNKKAKYGKEKKCKECTSVEQKRRKASPRAKAQEEARKLKREEVRLTTPAPTSKVCGDCKFKLPIGQFTRNAATKDGYALRCSHCQHVFRNTAEAKASQKISKEKYLASEKGQTWNEAYQQTPERKASKKLANARYRAKVKARSLADHPED